MKNYILKISALTLGLCTAITALSSCRNTKTETTTTALPETTANIVQTTDEPETVINHEGVTLEIATQIKNYTIYKPQTTAMKKEDVVYSYNIAQAPNGGHSDSDNIGNGENKKTENEYVYEKIEEKENGISIMAKTSSAFIGNTATVMIQGEAGKQYTLEFYKAPNEKADYEGLGTKKADENGIVSWTFEIGENCKKGNRKVLIKEKNSGNYAQSSITIQ